MATLRTHLFSSILLVLIVLTSAVQPAAAQTKMKHQKIPAGKDCSSCHPKIYAEWKAGPHGKNDVQCSVCHGEVAQGFAIKPSLAVCGQCHAEHALRPRS